MYLSGHLSDITHCVSIYADCVVPSTSCVTLPVFPGLWFDAKSSTDYLFEPHSRFIHTYGIIPLRSLHNPAQTNDSKEIIYVKFVNLSDFNVHLYSGTSLGLLFPLNEKSHIRDVTTNFLYTSPEVPSDTFYFSHNEHPSFDTLTEREHDLLNQLSFDSIDLPADEKAQLRTLLLEYSDIFALTSRELGHTDVIYHNIDTGDSSPIKQRQYRLPYVHRAELLKQTSEFLADGIIRKSNSPWLNPVIMVKKKDNTSRFCVDMRKVNSITRLDRYQLPHIQDILDKLSGRTYHTSLDMRSGYHQCEINESDKQKTAFFSGEDLYEFNRMAFGLSNAPATFQRLMNIVLSGLFSFSSVFLDDILISSTGTFQEHLLQVELVFFTFSSFQPSSQAQ